MSYSLLFRGRPLGTAAVPASQTRDARRLFRIQEGLSSFMVEFRGATPQQSWIGARQ
jgi:hypothetical protein